MQNLVSKNPIQRFKQGRKIVKAEEGITEMAGIYSKENKPLYQRIRFKQGGQLVSRNPITRFKNKKK